MTTRINKKSKNALQYTLSTQRLNELNLCVVCDEKIASYKDQVYLQDITDKRVVIGTVCRFCELESKYNKLQEQMDKLQQQLKHELW